MSDQVKTGGKTAESAILFVEEQLEKTISFMHNHELIHFDAHFHNMLTDGKMIYFTDFGLSLSSKFKSTPDEVKFLKTHRHFDRCMAAQCLASCIACNVFNADDPELAYQEYLRGERGEIAPFIASKLKQYELVVIAMNSFFQGLKEENKFDSYPSALLNRLKKATENLI